MSHVFIIKDKFTVEDELFNRLVSKLLFELDISKSL